jgi:RNA polymerase sigma-70 factor (ECF subfamily)
MSLGESFSRVLDAARAGAEWGVTALYRDLSDPVLRYLQSQEPMEAEDIASEAWIDVARALPRFRGGEDDLRRFVFTIARRRLVDHRRKAFRRRTQPVPTELMEPHLPKGDVEAEAVGGLTAREGAMALLSRLPREQAEIVLLRVVGGFTADEVARLVGKRAGTVRVLQHRALSRLAAELAREGVTPERLRAMW